jgi:Asp-tRNA(Asn)/Glu-tRNA(Gln) amidotransferase A subunit family amidase
LADVNIQLALEKRGQEKIPFSVKDHLKVQGMITTCGFSDNTTPSTDSSDVVVLL